MTEHTKLFRVQFAVQIVCDGTRLSCTGPQEHQRSSSDNKTCPSLDHERIFSVERRKLPDPSIFTIPQLYTNMKSSIGAFIWKGSTTPVESSNEIRCKKCQTRRQPITDSLSFQQPRSLKSITQIKTRKKRTLTMHVTDGHGKNTQPRRNSPTF